MFLRLGSFILVGILLATTMVLAQVDQNFVISKTQGPYSSDPNIAINTQTGDVLVSFIVSNANDTSIKPVICIVLCKKKKNGSYRIGKTYTITDGSYSVFDQSQAYNAVDNSYVVAWTGTPRQIYIQNVTKKGKPRDAIRVLTTDASKEYAPAIAAVPEELAEPAYAQGSYLVLYRRDWQENGAERRAVYGVFLEATGQPSGSPFFIKEDMADEFNFLPNFMYTAIGGGYFVAGSRYYNNYAAVAPHAIKVDADGTFLANTDFAASGNWGKLIQLKKTLVIATWLSGTTLETLNAKGNASTLALKNSTFRIDNTLTAAWGEPVKLNNDAGGYYFFTNANRIMGRYINASGKFKGTSHTYIQVQDTVRNLTAVCLPGSNKLFLAYAVLSGDKSEIRGIIADAVK